MTDFSKSYSVRWSLCPVIIDTWADMRASVRMEDMKLTRTSDGLLESGNITVILDKDEQFQPQYYRVIANVSQGGAVTRHEIATLYCFVTSGDVNHGITEASVYAASVLYPASTTVMRMGTYLPKGANGAEFVRHTLEDCINAPVVAEGSFSLVDDFVFDLGANVLESIWSVLNACGWCLQIDGHGTVTVRALPTEPSLVMSGEENSVTFQKTSYDQNWNSVPNRYIATDGYTYAEVTNEDPDSTVSIPSRGFVKDADGGVDTSPVLINGESLSSYCERRLRELSAVSNDMTYDRRYEEGVVPFSIVQMVARPSGERRETRVKEQKLECGAGITVTETVTVKEQLWQ